MWNKVVFSFFLPEGVGVSSHHLQLLLYFPLWEVVHCYLFVYHKYDLMLAYKNQVAIFLYWAKGIAYQK